MSPQWLRLAADLLETASEHFANHVCNDVQRPDGWTDADVVELNRQYEAWNSLGRDFNPEDTSMPLDWMAMSFLAHTLRQEAETQEGG